MSNPTISLLSKALGQNATVSDQLIGMLVGTGIIVHGGDAKKDHKSLVLLNLQHRLCKRLAKGDFDQVKVSDDIEDIDLKRLPLFGGAPHDNAPLSSLLNLINTKAPISVVRSIRELSLRYSKLHLEADNYNQVEEKDIAELTKNLSYPQP